MATTDTAAPSPAGSVLDAGRAAAQAMLRTLGSAQPAAPEPTPAAQPAPDATPPQQVTAEPAATSPTPVAPDLGIASELKELIGILRQQPAAPATTPAPEPAKPDQPPTIAQRLEQARAKSAREILGPTATEDQVRAVVQEMAEIERLQAAKAVVGDDKLTGDIASELQQLQDRLAGRVQSASVMAEIRAEIDGIKSRIEERDAQAKAQADAESGRRSVAQHLRANEEIRKNVPGLAALARTEESAEQVASLIWELSDGGQRQIVPVLERLVSLAMAGTRPQSQESGQQAPPAANTAPGSRPSTAPPTLTQTDAATTTRPTQSEPRQLTQRDVLSAGNKAALAAIARLKAGGNL